jgi:DNA-binding GntR family transcriptional regulator
MNATGASAARSTSGAQSKPAARSKKAAALPSLPDQLIARIKEGFYAPGQRLIEAELMADFGLGRSAVRETLKTLVGEGYLSFEKNRGACVRRFTRQEALERAHVREMLEGLAARQVAARGLDKAARAHLKQLQKALDKGAKDKDFRNYSQLNEEFHDFILTHSGNEYAADLLKRLSVPLFRTQFTGLFTTAGLFERNEDHRRISEAILAEDPDAAERAMRDHVGKGIQAMLTLRDDEFA